MQASMTAFSAVSGGGGCGMVNASTLGAAGSVGGGGGCGLRTFIGPMCMVIIIPGSTTSSQSSGKIPDPAATAVAGDGAPVVPGHGVGADAGMSRMGFMMSTCVKMVLMRLCSFCTLHGHGALPFNCADSPIYYRSPGVFLVSRPPQRMENTGRTMPTEAGFFSERLGAKDNT
ncbi:hypothetical protein Cob_v000189 [Colletotrichum orbiculare MAFF 240422]|uniref:Uncharacterized protein n=1 Tax=Colletotrichum orbiculare (strain 104-T / ATCC 96160 / CBS 514.97 / LARS 414 / MAFF 240422) TaxID=1213857 RepID=A0A484G9P4_COLOR|nr:hypothetical protein Cob_v000189 [Colletotrichum orbiculare MAFF 240422]